MATYPQLLHHHPGRDPFRSENDLMQPSSNVFLASLSCGLGWSRLLVEEVGDEDRRQRSGSRRRIRP